MDTGAMYGRNGVKKVSSPTLNLLVQENKMQQLNLCDKTKPNPGASAIRKIAFDDPATSDSGSDSRRVNKANKGDDFVMLDFKTPFSAGARPSSASDLQASVSATTTDLVRQIRVRLWEIVDKRKYRVRKQKWEFTSRGCISLKQSTLRLLFGTIGELSL